MNLTGKQIIGFETKASGHRNFQGIQAATGEALPQIFVEATDGEANEALSKASAAFKVYRKLSDERRAQFFCLTRRAHGLEQYLLIQIDSQY